MSAEDPYFDASPMVNDELLKEVSPKEMEEVVEEAPDEEDYAKVYPERGVQWGTQDPDVVFRVSVDLLRPVQGNIFYPEKLALFTKLITSGRYPTFGVPWGYASLVDLQDVAESQENVRNDEDLFWSHGMSRPYTTDDEDLDWYLADPEGYLGENADYDWDSTDEEDEAAKESLRSEMDEMAKTAEEEGWGDLGALTVQVRDGNHRVFTAQIAGESYAWIHISDINDLSDDELEQLR